MEVVGMRTKGAAEQRLQRGSKHTNLIYIANEITRVKNNVIKKNKIVKREKKRTL